MADLSRALPEPLVYGCGLSSSVVPGGESEEKDGLGRRLVARLGGRETCAAERLLKVADDALGELSLPEAEFRWRDDIGMRDLECWRPEVGVLGRDGCGSGWP